MSKILFFIAGNHPTNYDRQVAASLPGVQYRNVNNIKATDPVEPCDSVMGLYIPPQYVDIDSANAAMTALRISQQDDAQTLKESISIAPPQVDATVPAPVVETEA